MLQSQSAGNRTLTKMEKALLSDCMVVGRSYSPHFPKIEHLPQLSVPSPPSCKKVLDLGMWAFTTVVGLRVLYYP